MPIRYFYQRCKRTNHFRLYRWYFIRTMEKAILLVQARFIATQPHHNMNNINDQMRTAKNEICDALSKINLNPEFYIEITIWSDTNVEYKFAIFENDHNQKHLELPPLILTLNSDKWNNLDHLKKEVISAINSKMNTTT